MNNFLQSLLFFIQTNPYVLPLIGIWDLIWKGLSLWKAGRNGQRNWFVALLIVNSLGILPMIYLKFFQKVLNKK